MSLVIFGLATVLGIAHLAAREMDHKGAAGVLKALPVLLVAWGAASHPMPVDDGYRWWIVVGLIFGAGGDVLLLRESTFVHGLASFLVGHLCYLTAFGAAGVVTMPIAVAVGLLAVGAAGMLRHLWPHLGRKRGAVAVYVSIIMLMCARAWMRAATGVDGGWLAAVGATSFVVSDGALAQNRFVQAWPSATRIVMTTYYAAQFLLAASVGF